MSTDAYVYNPIPPDERDPRIQAALAELRDLIARRFPAATFTVSRGEDPEGIYLTPLVDVEDLDEVTDTVLDRLLDMQVEEGLPVYVVPDWPLERVRAHLRRPAPPVAERLRALALP
ncbi:MAG TPA: hypothetical protein VFL91_01815 [Thermomicrobiales bacterium]|nr:hypothetical protein [Thermomicrobiales bacterium]